MSDFMGNQRIRTCDVKLVKIHLPKKRKQNDESKANKKFKFGDEEYFVNWNISPKKQNHSFQCQVCNKGFKDGTALLYHQIYHPQPVSPSLRQFAVPDETASRLSGEGIINKSPAMKGGSVKTKRIRVKSSLDNSIPRIRDNSKNNELTGSSTTTPPASPNLSAAGSKRNLRLRLSKQSNAGWKVDEPAANSQVNKERRNNKTEKASESDRESVDNTPRSRHSSTDTDSGFTPECEKEEPEVLTYGKGKRPRWNLFGTVRTPTSVWRKQKRKSNTRSHQGNKTSDNNTTPPISDNSNKKSDKNNLNNSQANTTPKQVCDTKTNMTVPDKDVISDEHENTKDDPVIEKSSKQRDSVSLDKNNKEQVKVKKNDMKLDRQNGTDTQNDDNISATNSDNEPCKEIHNYESFPDIYETASEINVTSKENNIDETKCSQDESFVNDVEEINGSLSSINHSIADLTTGESIDTKKPTNGVDKNVHGSVIEIENDDFDDDFCGLPSSAPGSSPNYVNNLLKPINMSDSDLDEIQAVCEKVNSAGGSPCLLASSPSKPLSRTFPNLLENNNSDISLILEKFDGSSIPGIFENGQETPEVVAMCSASSNSTNIDIFPQILEDDIANFGFQSAAGEL